MKHFFVFLSLLLLIQQNVESQTSKFRPAFSIVVDASIGKDLLKQCSRSTPGKVASFWTPGEADIIELESNFSQLESISATECCIGGAKIDSLKKFGLQYLGIKIKGQKYIYINTFPFSNIALFQQSNKDLSKTAIKVCDGGASFWGVLFNVNTKKFSSLAFNGIA